MRSYRRIASFLAAVWLAFSADLRGSTSDSSEVGFPLVSAYAPEQIGSDGQSYSAAQDTNGVMIFGGNGLSQFDGERWTNTNVPGLRCVYGLDFGPDGRLWAAAEGEFGWFQKDAFLHWTYHSLASRLSESDRPHGQIFQVLANGNGAVFIAPERVYSWNGSTFQMWDMPHTRRITGFRIAGKIYVHDRLKGLFRLDDTGPELVIPQSLIGDEIRGAILWIDASPTRWLIATGNGLIDYRDGHTRQFAPEVSRILHDAMITCGARLPDGRFAFGTVESGIVLMRSDGTLDSVLSEQNGFPVSYVTSLFIDRQSNLWATSKSGVFRLDVSGGTRMFDSRASLSPQVYRAITRAKGVLTTANSLGVFALGSRGQQFQQVAPVRPGMHDIISSAEGLILCGYRGAWRAESGSVVLLHSSVHDVQTALPSFVRSGTVFLSEDFTPIIIEHPQTGGERIAVRGLPAPATSLAEDSEGVLFMATEAKGIYVARLNSTSAALPSEISSVYDIPAPQGLARVASSANGHVVVVAANGAWEKTAGTQIFKPINGFPRGSVTSISNVATDGAVWFIHPASSFSPAFIAEAMPGKHGLTWSPRSIRGLETIGMPTSIFVEKNAAGVPVVWVGGTKAVLMHTVQSGIATPRPQAPLLLAYSRSTTNQPREQIVSRLPYTTKEIDFEFAEPDYVMRPQLRLETKIDGIDADWIPAGHDSVRELTALREGKYVFRVRAVAETGVASEPTVFEFEVAPPWWRTPQATIAFVLVLIPLGYGVYWLRVRALRQHNVELEQKVQERTEELAEASAAKTLFVANMSHDIRNPLNGIVGLALALEETKLDTKQREIIATLRECTTYLSSLVDDVLDFASIEAGRIELRAGPFVPADLLNSIVTTLRGEASQRGAFVTIETDPDVPRMLRGDAGRIQQILVNYLGNALKYAGGHIRLSVGLAPNSPGEVEFAVADEGPGISSAEQKTLFSKFARLDGARKDQIPGTGLGLASCRLLADAMGGSVGIESRVGEGSRFFLRLPLSIATEPVRVPDDVSFPRTSVLLVEDTDYNAMAATAVLAKLGLTCDRARTGEEAIRMFGEKRHNVVLLDRNLPDLDGTEVARQMRELETDGLRSVLLAVTAYCTAEDRELCLKAGMDAFVGKPLTPDKLRRVLIDAGRRLLTTASIDASAEVHAAALDTSLLEYLADGTPGGLATQAERFITALSEAHAEVLAAHAAGELNALGDAAHRVLGHGRMVGATALTKAAIALESAARKGDAATATLCLPNLAAEIEKLTGALRRRPGVQKV